MKTIGQRLTTTAGQRLKLPPKQADPHYHDPRHAAWSQAVRRRAGGRCECKGCRACGASGCGREGERLFADHVVELKDGGAPFDLGNGQALCGACHTVKTAAARAARCRE